MSSAVRSVVESLANQYLKWWKQTSDGKNINGACPFHHETTEGAFYMSTETGLWICHGCQARGSLPTFLKEVGAPARMRTVVMDQVGSTLRKPERPKLARKDQFKNHMALSEGLLGIFNFCPSSLVEAGFSKETLRKYEVGFDKEAMRITFPIRNHLGVLMGIAGRTVIGENPRYLIYKEDALKRFSDKYRGYEFNKKNFLWNYHNVYPNAFHSDLNVIYVVEGYKAAMWVAQAGFTNVVALMGSYLSEMQRALLQRTSADIYFMLDNKEEAEKGVYDAGKRLRAGNRVFVCQYPDDCGGGEQPDDLTTAELKTSINEAESFNRWRKKYAYTRPNTASSWR
jgi:DNA primase